MANLVLGTVGAVAGFVISGFNPVGAQIGWAIGSTAGSLLFPPKGPDGPRLNDLSVQVSTYGTSLPRSWGTTRRSGNVIWAADLQEHAHEEGGKGGPSYTTYSYTCSFAVSFGEGPIVGIRRMWAGGKLIYDVSSSNTGPTKDFTATSFVIYTGSETQTVDPTIQAAMTNAPAYRGQCYVVFTDLQLEKFGNRLPFDLQAEVVVDGSYALPPPLAIGSGNYGVMQPGTPYFWSTLADTPGSGQTTVYVTNVHTQQTVKSLVIPVGSGQRLDYVPLTAGFGEEVWVAKSAPAADGVEATTLNSAGMVASRTIEFSGSSVRWLGLVRYSSTRGEVYFASINGVSDVVMIVSTSGSVMATLSGGFWVQDMLPIDVHGLVAATGGPLSAGTQSMMLIDATERSIVGNFSASSFGSPSAAKNRIAFDSTRDRLVWFNEGTLDHFYLVTVSALGIVGQPIQTSLPAALPQGLKALIYHKGLDRFIGHGSTTTYVIHPETWAIESSSVQGQGATDMHEVDGINDYVLATNGNTLYRYYLANRLTTTKVPVSTIVTDLSVDVGLTAGDIDVTDLTGVLCDGFLLARQGSARSAVEQLMMGYQFDALESVGKVKFVRRGTRPATVIDADSLAVHEYGQDVPTALQLTRTDEVELPRSITVKYMNIGADHQIGAQSSIRQTVRSVNDITWELPIVMSDAHAKGIADAGHYSAWAARNRAKFSTTMKFADKEPTDLVNVEGNLIRITKRTMRGNALDFEGALDSGMVFAVGAVAGAAQSVAQTIPLRSSTAVEFMDIPLLRDQDNDAGFYVGASGYPGMTWDGCVLFKSSDGGGTWEEVATLTTAATMGAATTTLGDFSQNVFDEFNTVTVRLRNGTLSSATEMSVLNGSNAALLGSELIQFRTATLNADGTYTLSGLLRGRKGSPTSGHVIGDRFVLLNTTSVRRIDMSTAELNIERLYKAVSIGDTLAGTTTKKFTNTGIGLECLSGVHLGGGRNAAGDVTINWTRRTRIGGEWRDYVDASLGETSESYEVEIWTGGFTALKRTITGLSTPTASYTSAQQVTDFGSNQSTFSARIYQLSATAGRGFVLSGVVREVPHRYWRVYITATNGHADTNAAEIELRETVSGSDVTGSGTASASTYYSPENLLPSKAFDNNTGTWWGSGGSVPHWIKYDFGAGVSKNIMQVSYTVRNDGFTDQAPKDFKVQWSDDDATWIDALSVSGQTGWASGETRVFNV